MRIVKWILGSVAALLVIAVVGGASYQRIASSRDAARFPMPGQRVDVGGRVLHLWCTGSGTTTVLLENGLSANYASWLLVQPALAEFTKVCSYDRAGMGWSDASPNPTRAEFVAADLHRLRDAAKLDSALVLVGWSAGGVFMRRYYAEHPEGVVGMVLVDSSHEQQRDRLPSSELLKSFEARTTEQLALCRNVSWMGVVRVAGAMEALAVRAKLPDALRDASIAMSNRTGYCTGVAKEIDGFGVDLSVETPPASLGDLPLVVLTRGRPSSAADFPVPISQSLLDEQDRVWTALQSELAGLSSQSSHRIVASSGHGIPIEAAEAVVDAVRDLLEGSVGVESAL